MEMKRKRKIGTATYFSEKNNRKNRWLSLFFILFIIVAAAGPAYAGDPIRKLGRGITNAATGWLEIFFEIGRQVEESGDMAGIIVGPFKGTAKFVGRTLVGVYDVVTFLLPLPADYEPLLEPEFVFELSDV